MNSTAASSRTLLAVEDDPGIQKQLRWCFDGYEVALAGDRESALTQIRRIEPSVVLLDLGLPPDPANASEGLAALEEILDIAPHTKVIVVTGNDERENAVKAVALGAYDFYQKPIDAEVLKLIVDRAYQLHELELEYKRLANRQVESPLQGIIAISPEMVKICRLIEKVAPTDVTVLLLGESGTGKELLARALHDLSPRKDSRFVAINCAAIPDTLLESELFGYEKGAFTGAARQTPGKIEYADKGTLFLDEIGDMPTNLQSKLLRFLQERVVERVGGRDHVEVDARIVCATNQDLSSLIKQGKFRDDLYYRVNEISIQIPPLRQRTGDAIVLARGFLDIYSRKQGRSIKGFTDDALNAIESYDWPGNARELENSIKRAVIMAEGNFLSAADLGLQADGQSESSVPFNLKQVRESAEHSAVQRALSMSGGRVSKTAELLGVSRPTLYNLMSKYGLK